MEHQERVVPNMNQKLAQLVSQTIATMSAFRKKAAPTQVEMYHLIARDKTN